MEIANTISILISNAIFLIYINSIVKRIEILEKEIKEVKYNYTDRFEDIKDVIHKVDVKVEKIVARFCKGDE